MKLWIKSLDAIYLNNFGWYRIDARGNKQGLCAEFTLPVEKLPFLIEMPGEADLPEIWAEPLPMITEILTMSKTYQEVADNLPDIELIKA